MLTLELHHILLLKSSWEKKFNGLVGLPRFRYAVFKQAEVLEDDRGNSSSFFELNWTLSAVDDSEVNRREGKVQLFYDLQPFTRICFWCMQVPNP